MTDDTSHAIRNAQGHAESICELYRAYRALSAEGVETSEADGAMFDDPDAVIEQAQERALSVDVRSGWYSAGMSPEPEQYRILLTTGGPALQLIGDLNRWTEPEDMPTLQWQDWGTPWTDYYPADLDDWDAAAEWFVRLFYYGE